VTAAIDHPTVTEQERRYLMARRQAIIIDLGAIEDYLGLERSIVPRRKREPRPPEELRERFDRAVGYNSPNEKESRAVR